MEVSSLECFIEGGTFSGEGSACLTVDCTGACCLPDETCDDTLTKIECEDLGGTFKGNGLACAEVACGLRGACCLQESGCVPQLTYIECTSGYGGTWMGYGTTCSSIDVLNCMGACCFDDASCVGSVSRGECDELLGSFRDFGSRCGGGPEGANTVCDLQSTEAKNATLQRKSFNFVMIDGVDRNFTFQKFDDQNGLRQLERVHIEISGYIIVVVLMNNSSDAAFVIDDAVTISEDMSIRFSENTDDLPTMLEGIWRPAMPIEDLVVQCDDNVLHPGQWCAFASPYFFPGFGDLIAVESFEPSLARRGSSSFLSMEGDTTFTVTLNGSSGFTSTLQGQGSITRNPHRAMGDIRVTYEYSLPRGACCLLDGTCVDYVTSDWCTDQPDEILWTPGQLCENLDTFGDSCLPRGACCLCDGSCLDAVTEDECNAFFGADAQFHLGLMCEEITCEPRGLCCLPDETCQDWRTEAACHALDEDAIWLECDACSEVECPAIGACFFPTDPCDVLAEDECLAQGGFFLGPGSDCQNAQTCDGDANFDQIVDLADLLIVLSNWGTAADQGDVDFDCTVALSALLLVLSNWGCNFS